MHIGLTGPVDLSPLLPSLDHPLPAVPRGPSTGWLARTWLDQGHRVTVFAMSHEVTSRAVFGSGCLQLVVTPMRPSKQVRDLFRYERRQLAAALREHPTDVVSAHWTYEYARAAIASGRPAFVTARDTPLRCAWEMRDVYRWLRHTQALPAVHRATALSANSPYTARHLRRCLGVRRPIEVIPNGVRTDALPTLCAPPPGDDPVFAAALQGWGPLKNTKALLRAFALVRRGFPKARLLILGSDHGPGGPAQAWARDRDVTAGVEFAGQLPHAAMMNRLATEAHVLVHPSRLESFSMICAEAMGMGLPVVAGRRSGAVPWVVGPAGLLVDIDRPDRIAKAMTTLARDDEQRTALGAAGMARVRGHFSLDDIARHYVNWFTTTDPHAR
ncbi:glycosyltransferase family 4 protein [Streptomyces sp. NPDC096046]|uniref:glycosyltransferase family 4 protein n=1 Tax=Streptomyces sp. NPDC096046 TaxID=3155542 RepID=UPI00331D7B04